MIYQLALVVPLILRDLGNIHGTAMIRDAR